ncbi:MAG: hypothetical protein WBX25_30560 [Rhodomicrobium sp.]
MHGSKGRNSFDIMAVCVTFSEGNVEAKLATIDSGARLAEIRAPHRQNFDAATHIDRHAALNLAPVFSKQNGGKAVAWSNHRRQRRGYIPGGIGKFMVPGELRERLIFGPVVTCLVAELPDVRFPDLAAKAKAREVSRLREAADVDTLIDKSGDGAVREAIMPELISALDGRRPVFAARGAGVILDRVIWLD